MAVFQAYKLHFPDGLHLAVPGFADEGSNWMIHSDTLFGALCRAYRLHYGVGALEEWLRWVDDHPLRLSSCFPFKGAEYFFPAPMRNRDWYSLSFPEAKRLRKRKLLPLPLFNADLNDRLRLEEWAAYPYPDLYSEVERPRVMVDRVNQRTQIFHFAEVHFPPDGGLFFLVQFPDGATDRQKQQFEAALRLLGDEGIGADTTVGKGLFEAEPVDIHLDLPLAGSQYTLLSLYNPTEAELGRLLPAECYYQFTGRGGWISSGAMNLKRRTVRMLTEGSILRFTGPGTPAGRLVLVLDAADELPHDVYRYGQALALPIH